VYASPGAIQGAVNKFLGIEASGGPRGSLEGTEEEESSKDGDKGKKKKRAKEQKPRLAKPKPPGSDGLVPAREAGEAEGKTVARKVGDGFPVFYPTRLPSGAAYVESSSYLHIQDPRVYHFKDTDGNRHGAYRMVVAMDLPDGTHYFGVQGIQGWSDPPILSNPSLTKTIRGREYDIYVDGDRVKMIAWHRGDNSYWVSNSLLQVLTNDQMVGIARSASVIMPNKKPKKEKVSR
jgi:polyisoprenyl-teichoic acid--peptidoglycan teichoic acid transferase